MCMSSCSVILDRSFVLPLKEGFSIDILHIHVYYTFYVFVLTLCKDGPYLKLDEYFCDKQHVSYECGLNTE